MRSGGLFLLKPSATVVEIFKRADVVEWRGRKPCWCSAGGRCVVMMGRIKASRVFTAGHKSEIGRYDVAKLGSFPGFGSGTTSEVFQIAGIRPCAKERLKISVRSATPIDPRCFR